MKQDILDDVKRHLDYVNATNQKSIRDIEMQEMYFEIKRLHSIIKEVREYIEKVETLAMVDKVNIFSMSTLKMILDKENK